jgi:hypothetical protein
MLAIFKQIKRDLITPRPVGQMLISPVLGASLANLVNPLVYKLALMAETEYAYAFVEHDLYEPDCLE